MNRENLYADLCKDLSGVYVEIGTCWGNFADFLLSSTPCSKLFCIDPYKKFQDLEYVDSLNTMTQEEMDAKFLAVQNKLKKSFGERITMLRNLSTDAASLFEDNSLDFVYIDGNHMFDAVLEDLHAWYPKVKPGGILAGDDVEPLENSHEYEKNSFVVHKSGAFGLYGVHLALLEFQKKFPEFQFQLFESQFYWKKPNLDTP